LIVVLIVVYVLVSLLTYILSIDRRNYIVLGAVCYTAIQKVKHLYKNHFV